LIVASIFNPIQLLLFGRLTGRLQCGPSSVSVACAHGLFVGAVITAFPISCIYCLENTTIINCMNTLNITMIISWRLLLRFGFLINSVAYTSVACARGLWRRRS
jgi:hypothetical protein